MYIHGFLPFFVPLLVAPPYLLKLRLDELRQIIQRDDSGVKSETPGAL